MDHSFARLGALLLAVLASACSGAEGLDGATGTLRLSPKALDFPRTFIGHPTEAQLELHNTGRARLAFSVEASGPFQVSETKGQVEGSGVRSLRIRFEPSLPGSYREHLLVRTGGRTLEVSLTGEGVRPPTCRASGHCRQVQFDPITGECVEERAADGSVCESGNACMVGERCVAGACIGSPRQCDDGNVCTEDYCDPAHGCRSLERNDCPEPDEPCRVAVCDPTAGCGVGIAEDGTPCGPTSCAGAHVCWQGTCRQVEVPDGFPCTADCGAGGCSNGVCVREQGDVLSPLWRYRPAQEGRLLFPGIADPGGNLYWLECSHCPDTEDCPPEACSPVSATGEGFERFRIPPLPGPADRMGRTLTLAGSTLLLVTETTVRAYSSLDGKARWEADLEERFRAGGRPCPCVDEVLSLTRAGDEQVVVALTNAAGAALLALDRETGTTRWLHFLDEVHLPAGPIADAEGNLYLLAEKPPGSELVSLAPGGEERWRRPAAGRLPLAANGALLLVGDEEGVHALRSKDGVHRWSRAPARALVASLQQGWAVEAGEEDAADESLVGFELVEGETTGRIPLAPGGTLGPPLLGPDGRLLFLAEEPSEKGMVWYLGEGRNGSAEWSRRCFLPEARLADAPWITGPGRLTVLGEGDEVITFEAPSVELGPAGWVTPWGGPGAGRAAR